MARAFSDDVDTYPVLLHVTPPVRWDRVQILLRVAIFALLAAVGVSVGWLSCALYLLLPVVAAVLISGRGAEGYLVGPGRDVARVLAWWNALLAYLLLLTDRFPLGREEPTPVRFDVVASGHPTVGRALMRLITSLPEAIVLVVLSTVASVVWLIGAIAVLVDERVPAFAWRYLHFVLELQARLLAYHASLVDPYPPLRLPTHAEAP